MITGLHVVAYTGIALWLLTMVGNYLCRELFCLTGMRDAIANAPSDVLPVGRIIGWLERLIVAIGLIVHSWEVLAAVIALKTVARFKELDKKLPAEYFLVGSLFSILWAMAITGTWMAYDHHWGGDLRYQAVQWLGQDDRKAGKG